MASQLSVDHLNRGFGAARSDGLRFVLAVELHDRGGRILTHMVDSLEGFDNDRGEAVATSGQDLAFS